MNPHHGTQLLQNIIANYMQTTMQQQQRSMMVPAPTVPLPSRNDHVKTEPETREKRKSTSAGQQHGRFDIISPPNLN